MLPGRLFSVSRYERVCFPVALYKEAREHEIKRQKNRRRRPCGSCGKALFIFAIKPESKRVVKSEGGLKGAFRSSWAPGRHNGPLKALQQLVKAFLMKCKTKTQCLADTICSVTGSYRKAHSQRPCSLKDCGHPNFAFPRITHEFLQPPCGRLRRAKHCLS